MDQLVRTLREQGTHDSSAEFTISPRHAADKLAQFRVADPSFPYWKFLQGAFTSGCSLVKIGVGRSSVTIEAYSDRGFPALDEVCNQLPVGPPSLEAWRSCALALSGEAKGSVILAREGAGGELEVFGNDGDGAYAAGVPMPKLPRREKSNPGLRICLVHAWQLEGGFFARMFGGMKERAALEQTLRYRASAYPHRCLLSGHAVAANGTDQVFAGTRVACVFYRGVSKDDEGRFASDAFSYGAFCNLAVLRDGKPESLGPRLFGFTSVIFEPLRGAPASPVPCAANLESGHFQKIELGVELEPCGFRARSCRAVTVGKQNQGISNAGPVFFVDFAVLLPAQLGGPGRLAVIDRGVLLGTWSVDLGVPGLMVTCSARGLDVDLSGTEIVKNEAWETRLRELRSQLPVLLEAAIPEMIPGSQCQNSYRELLSSSSFRTP